MTFRFSLLLTFVLCALALIPLAITTAPETALACACCDGGTSRTVVGWSASGRSVLVENHTVMACEEHRFLEVWEVGSANPVGCFDLYSRTPDRRVACDLERFTPAYDEDTGAQRGAASPASRLRLFPQAPSPLSARYVRARLAPPPPPDDGDDALRLTVEVFGARGFTRVHEGDARRYVYYSPADDDPEHFDMTVTVYPSPRGRRALLLVEHVETMPGIGHNGVLVEWVGLPDGVPATTGAPPDLPRTALPIPTERRAPREHRQLSIKANRAGMVFHRAGDFTASAREFARAAFMDAGNHVARVNLACALARLGANERALALLEELRALGTARALDALAHAATDEDLRALRAMPSFGRIVGGARR